MCENADQKNSKYGHFSRIKDQGGKQIKALEKHGKQLVASSSQWKRLFNAFKTKNKFWRTCEGKNGWNTELKKKINFNNWIYFFKGLSDSKKILVLKVH